MTTRWQLDYVVEGISESDSEEILYTLRYALLVADNRAPIWAEFHEEDGTKYWQFRCDDVPEFYGLCRQEQIANWFVTWAERHNTYCGGGLRPITEDDDGQGKEVIAG